MTTEITKNQFNVYLYYETVPLNLFFSPFYAPYFTKAATKTNGGSVKPTGGGREDE